MLAGPSASPASSTVLSSLWFTLSSLSLILNKPPRPLSCWRIPKQANVFLESQPGLCWRARSKPSSPAKTRKHLLSGWNTWLIAHTCQRQATINREIGRRKSSSLYYSNEIKWSVLRQAENRACFYTIQTCLSIIQNLLIWKNPHGSCTSMIRKQKDYFLYWCRFILLTPITEIFPLYPFEFQCPLGHLKNPPITALFFQNTKETFQRVELCPRLLMKTKPQRTSRVSPGAIPVSK